MLLPIEFHQFVDDAVVMWGGIVVFLVLLKTGTVVCRYLFHIINSVWRD